MAIIQSPLVDGPARVIPCAQCKVTFGQRYAEGSRHVFQIRNENGIEHEGYCSRACAQAALTERGRKVRYCGVCSKAIPKRIRELYPHATFCSEDCTEQHRELDYW